MEMVDQGCNKIDKTEMQILRYLSHLIEITYDITKQQDSREFA
jgi:hypothetical protein